MIHSKNFCIFFNIIIAIILSINGIAQDVEVPLAEHPRPDLNRPEWMNLNGIWSFEFDTGDVGEDEGWYAEKELSRKITVPFSWGAPLSGVADEGDIGWYSRKITIPDSWEGKRVFIIVGASDWNTKGWLDGQYLGENRGGYTPFEFELTSHIKYGKEQKLSFRVDDTAHDFKLEGKQGYGKARGIWQTVYLEARGNIFVDHIHITPDIDKGEIMVDGKLSDPLKEKSTIYLEAIDERQNKISQSIKLEKEASDFHFSVSIPDAILWSLDNPHLYDVKIVLGDKEPDNLNTYFGMRKISVVNYPGLDYPYVALNNKPVYVQLALDQAYHPEGYYTFPSDEFMRDEIIRSKKIGLNGQRIHVKIGIPRKLYWADKLGLLIMADVPNSWGAPDKEMQFETEKALRDMVKRDFNHPSIFSWVVFNETWGLMTRDDNKSKYLPETQKWVKEMYELTKSLDPTRLVEDNSANRRDHVATDLNTWHAYLPGYAWEEFLDDVEEQTYPGSEWNFIEGYVQGNQPNINSECGNVWGYQGSTGDVDWSWDYHIMINEFRKHPKVAGWLYTEHHDVINEWNGYYKYDRSNKYTGLEDFNGMTINDLHSPVQITPDIDLMTSAAPGQELEIPIWLSVFTDRIPYEKARIKYFWEGINSAGIKHTSNMMHQPLFSIESWQLSFLEPLHINAPEEEGLAILHLVLETSTGISINKNFVVFKIENQKTSNAEVPKSVDQKYKLVSIAPSDFSNSQWSVKQWNVLDGLKVNGAGYGYFEYEVLIPDEINSENVSEAIFKIELSAKQLFGKDASDSDKMSGDYMRGRGTHDPSRNPNSYPMTDDDKYPSYARIKVNDFIVKEVFLPDDPADHRGVLSWNSQNKDQKLREAGSYGYLVEAGLPSNILADIIMERKCKITIEVPQILAGGLAVYGKDFGRYPIDPTIVFMMK